MNRRDRLAPHNTTASLAIVRLLVARVQRRKSMQPFLKLGREAVISRHLAVKQRISALIRRVKHIQERRPRRLRLIRHIRVPSDRVCSRLEHVQGAVVVGAAVHEVDFGVALGGAAGGVDVESAEIGAEFESVRNGDVRKVLVAEYC